MSNSTKLKKNFVRALLAVIIALVSISTATFAWYSFNSGAKTTDIHMAAGSTSSLFISNEYDGVYGLTTPLEQAKSALNPVSTDKILGGFQKVYGFTDGSDVRSKLAKLFKPAESSDYYKTSLYIKSTEDNTNLYLQDIGFIDSDKNMPMSMATRVGFVVHKPGEDQPVDKEFIFEINDGKFADGYQNEAYYNTFNGTAGDVLDSSKNDGSTVKFDPYGPKNYCGTYNTAEGKLEMLPDTIVLGLLTKAELPMQIDVYIWLEGCDPECTNAVASNGSKTSYLESMSFTFAGAVN